MEKIRGSNIEVKKINRNQIFRYVNKYEKVSKPDIAAALGISMPTVLQNVKELMDRGLICEVGEFESTGGRKAKVIAPVHNARYAVGVDITMNHVSLVLTNLSGKVLKHSRHQKIFANERQYFKEMGEMAVKFLENAKIPKDRFLGFGISVAGIVALDNNKISISHAIGIRDVPFDIFSQFIPYPCIFSNDANAAGIAEMYGVDDQYDFVYLSLSNSVGGAIIFGKSNAHIGEHSSSIFFGDNFRSGEFGHMMLMPGGGTCYCGKRGCVDVYCSAKVLAKYTDGKLEKFFSELENGNKEFMAAWEEYLSNLAMAIDNVRMAFDCSVIIGGYVGSFIEPYLAHLQEKAARLNVFENDALYIKPCRFRVEASALGAALRHVENFISSI